MPIIKSAKKRVRQDKVRRARNFAVRRTLRDSIKAFVAMIKGGDVTGAAASFAGLQKAVDMAVKKNIVHKNNAARKKSRFAKMLSAAQGYKG